MSPDIDDLLEESREVVSDDGLHSPVLDDQLVDFLLETDAPAKIQIACAPRLVKS